jgi:hypothetical protein
VTRAELVRNAPANYWPEWSLLAQTDKRSTAYAMARRERQNGRPARVIVCGDGWFWVMARPREYVGVSGAADALTELLGAE